MRAYTLSVLQKLAGSAKPIEDKEIIEWANKTVCKRIIYILLFVYVLVYSWKLVKRILVSHHSKMPPYKQVFQ